MRMVQRPSPSTFLTFYKSKYSLSDKSLKEQKNERLQKDWLTSFGHTHEIKALFPTCTEIQINDDNKHDPIAFQHKIALMFSFGHIFARFKQIGQAADMFLDA
jgi:hypothetical protein